MKLKFGNVAVVAKMTLEVIIRIKIFIHITQGANAMRNTLICTAGTSMKGNLMNSPDKNMVMLLEQKNIKGISLSLADIGPSERLAGAEINSITGILKQELLNERENLYILASDTGDGQLIGNVLKSYYGNRKNPFNFKRLEVFKIDGLTDESPHRFKTEGLRNLVKAISKIVKKHGTENVLINATGGYKAQISFAGMIGQALEIPVCYLFEKFSEVIELPPQPISLDLSFWLDHASLFFDLAADEAKTNPVETDPRFAGLVEEIEVEGIKVTGLSATGQLFHETFKYRFEKEREKVLPKYSGIEPDAKAIKYEDNNTGKHTGLKSYLDNILNLPYVLRIFTHYYNPDLPIKNYFRKSAKGNFTQIEGGYSDGKATTKFDIITTAKNILEQNATIADLSGLFA